MLILNQTNEWMAKKNSKPIKNIIKKLKRFKFDQKWMKGMKVFKINWWIFSNFLNLRF